MDKELLFVQAEVFLFEGDMAMVETLLARLSKFTHTFTLEEEDMYENLMWGKDNPDSFLEEDEEWT